MIEFEKIRETAIPNLNGGNGITRANMFMDSSVKIMLSTLEKGVSIGTHTHKTSSEIAYVLSGKARCVLDGAEEIVLPGQCHYCPQGSTHSIENASDEPLVLLDVVPEYGEKADGDESPYKTVVLDYSPKAADFAHKAEEKANEMAKEGFTLVTMSTTGSAKAVLVFRKV